MTCTACRLESRTWLCTGCRRSLVAAPDQIRSGVFVRSAFRHEGAARLLVHRMKYEAVALVADRLAVALIPLVPPDTKALIPVPRVTVRRWRYGVDPGPAVAAALGRRTGVPVARVLQPLLWVRQRAGPANHLRGRPAFRATGPAPVGAVLVDDVVTTGATLAAGAAVTGCPRAVTVTASGVGVPGAS